jgi:hypothetical protein
MGDAGAGAGEEVDLALVELDAVGVPDIRPGPAQLLASEKATSSAFSARWVWSMTCLSRASSAASRISSRVTEKGEQGAIATRTMAPSRGS